MKSMQKLKKTGLTILLVSLVFTVTACANPQKESGSVGASDPVSFRLEGLNNRTLDSTTVTKPMLLSFWATWCHFCREEMPVLESLYGEYEGRVEFAAVNLTHLDSVKSVEEYVQEQDLRLPVYLDKDGEVTELFQVVSTPTVVLLDQDGKVVYRKIGAGGKDSEKALKQQLDKILSEQPPKGG
jgi:thiol-disulfide isomerase/thioredoxin